MRRDGRARRVAGRTGRVLALLAGAATGVPAAGQIVIAAPAPAPAVRASPALLQSPIDALEQDAGEYARQYDVPLTEAMRRLRAQEDSVPATDGIQRLYRDRLAGIAIEHRPLYRIVVLLTGSAPVPDQSVFAGGLNVPIVFRTGAAATREQLVAALIRHQAGIRAALIDPPGIGVDPRSGELVVLIQREDADAQGVDAWQSRFAALTGVPVRIGVADRVGDFAIAGGARVVGVDPADGRRYACTSGFAVTDGTRTGMATAAHCPDALTYDDPDGERLPMRFVGGWGAGYQDVQIGAIDRPIDPLFYTDTAKTAIRTVRSWRNRASTRAGDYVCHRGERTGYSCAEVQLVDYAPAGDLCYGPCPPTWVTVAGPRCEHGDSGGPIFSGTTAFGIFKGGSYRPDGVCNFYVYMSTDYLPPPWSLLHR